MAKKTVRNSIKCVYIYIRLHFLFLKMEIEQRYAIAFCHRRKMKAEEILEIFTETYKDEAYGIDAIRYWLRQIKLGRTDLFNQPNREKPKDEEITLSIKYQIENNPFLSARQIAKTLGISPKTVIDRLTNDLHYKNYQTKWVPHELNSFQKNERVRISKEMLQILQKEQRAHFMNILTGDESWFLYEYTQSSQWVLSKDDLLNKVVKTNMQKKMFVTIFFNGNGLVLVDFLPKGRKFNSDYFINIINNIDEEIYPQGREKHAVKKLLHYDNAPIHKSVKVQNHLAKSNFRPMKHPAYSPDISPTDFGLFGTVKEKLIGWKHSAEKDLQDHIVEILGSFPHEFWQSLFTEWIERLKQVIANNGSYI